MKRTLLAASIYLAALLGGCATATNPCAGADARRTGYLAAIAAADVYHASGRPQSDAVELGLQAAMTALAMLDARCPRRPDG